jgi:hypothetical protein
LGSNSVREHAFVRGETTEFQHADCLVPEAHARRMAPNARYQWNRGFRFI